MLYHRYESNLDRQLVSKFAPSLRTGRILRRNGEHFTLGPYHGERFGSRNRRKTSPFLRRPWRQFGSYHFNRENLFGVLPDSPLNPLQSRVIFANRFQIGWKNTGQICIDQGTRLTHSTDKKADKKIVDLVFDSGLHPCWNISSDR